jgi:hypothetical protein
MVRVPGTRTCCLRSFNAHIPTVEFQLDRSPTQEPFNLLRSYSFVLGLLGRVRESTRSLTLSVNDDRSCFDLDALGGFDPTSTFRQFCTLDVLSILQQALISHSSPDYAPRENDLSEVIPHSLQELSFWWPNDQVVPWMRNLITAKKRSGSIYLSGKVGRWRRIWCLDALVAGLGEYHKGRKVCRNCGRDDRPLGVADSSDNEKAEASLPWRNYGVVPDEMRS